jgi:ADP-heptose:LPS heptosyltransferase
MHLSAKNRPREQQTGDGVSTILVLRFSSIGDIILTTPVLRAMRARWPEARITFVTRARFAGLLKGNPAVDEVETLAEPGGRGELDRLAARLERRKWDLLVDLHNSLRSRLLRRRVPASCITVYRKPLFRRSLLIYGRIDLYGPNPAPVPERYTEALYGLGVRLDGGPCELHPSGEDFDIFYGKLPPRWKDGRQFLALAPGAAWPVKRWPPERFAEAAGALCDAHGLRALVLGGEQEREICERVCQALGPELSLNLAGELPILASASALSRARLLIANDTGLMHAATAVCAPVVAVFGPTTCHFGYFPYSAASRVVEASLYCRPCTHNGRARCPLGHFRCMRDIKPGQVIAAAQELLSLPHPDRGAGE